MKVSNPKSELVTVGQMLFPDLIRPYQVEPNAVYVRVAVRVFEALLSPAVKDANIAEVMGPDGTKMPPSNLAGLLAGDRTLTGKIKDLERSLKTILKDRTLLAEVDEGRIRAARRFIHPGVEIAGKRFIEMYAALGVGSSAPKTSSSIPTSPLLAELLVSDGFDSEISDDQAFELVRSVYPGLVREQLGFAYATLGESLLEQAKPRGGHYRKAAQMFEQAVNHHVEALIESYRHLILCHVQQLITDQPTPEDVPTLPSKILSLSETIQVLADLYPMPLQLQAGLYKTLAEWTETTADYKVTTVDQEFARAAQFFKKAKGHHRTTRDSKLSDIDLAGLHHNIGYCLFKAGKGLEAEPELFDSIRQYAKLEVWERVGYNLKWLAIMFDDAGVGREAVWCARAAVAVYTSKGIEANESDIWHAKKTLSEIEGRRVPSDLVGNRPTTGDAASLAKQYEQRRNQIPALAGDLRPVAEVD